MGLRFAVFFTVTILAAAMLAGEARADRPFNLTSRGSITKPGDVYIEAGVGGFMHGRFLREFGTTVSPTLGIAPRVEVFLFGTLAKEYDHGDNNAPDEDNPLADPAVFPAGPVDDESDRRIDLVDPLLGLRVALLEGYLNEGEGPSIVADFILIFPETRKPAPDHLGFDVILEASQNIVEGVLDVHLNLGYELETSEQLCGVLYSGALELLVPGTEHLFALFEYAGSKFETVECDGTVLAGLQYTIAEPLFVNEAYLDIAVFRSDRGDPDWGFTAGISFGFGAFARDEEEGEEG